MNLTVRIPDALAIRLSEISPDLERQALEALVLESVRAGHMSVEELSDVLGFEVLDQVDGFLKAHGIYHDFGMSDLERQRLALDELGL